MRSPLLILMFACAALAAGPTVTSVSPNAGPSTGGTPVTITGTGFTNVTDISWNGASLGTGAWIVVNSTTITTSTPAGLVGPVSVIITAAGATNPANTLFAYLPAVPLIGGISPNSGSTKGGTNVTIAGAGFTGTTGVTIGGVPATNVKLSKDNQITATTGAGTAGIVSVAITNATGVSAANKLFTYVEPGTILFTQILGQPTDTGATVNLQANTAIELYYQLGTASGSYSTTTDAIAATADPSTTGAYVAQTVFTGLKADTQYYYRIQYRAVGSGAYTAGPERSFHTQRSPGSTFVFTVQGDSHPERTLKMFHSDLYNQTLAAAAAEKPDFHITNGDDFSVDTLQTPYTQAAVSGRYTLQLPYFNLLNTGALFLGTGNHEQTSLFNYNLPDDTAKSNQVPIWAQNARNLYYPVPGPNDAITGGFYSGNQTQLPNIKGNLRDYYAWTWGDALFVVIDPYWASAALVDSSLGSVNAKTNNLWQVTHGNAQYKWLQQTLQSSNAKWKFIFAHHVSGTGRGAVETAKLYEWGGLNQNGTPGFAANRQPLKDDTGSYIWPEPIHQLLVDNKVTVFFQGHDHLYVHQQLDGVHYQEVPNPADNTYTAFNADAYTQKDQSLYPDTGYVKVTVGPTAVNVQYIRQWLPSDAQALGVTNGLVQDSYTIGTPPPAAQTQPFTVSNLTLNGAVDSAGKVTGTGTATIAGVPIPLPLVLSGTMPSACGGTATLAETVPLGTSDSISFTETFTTSCTSPYTVATSFTVTGGTGIYSGWGGSGFLTLTLKTTNGAFTATGNLAGTLSSLPAALPTVNTGGIVPVYSSVPAIQPGSWVSLYGTQLAAGTSVWKGDFPTTLGGTSVSVNGKPAYLWLASPGQINFQAPDDTATGVVPVTVTTPAGTTTSTVTLAPAAPSFSLLDGKHVTGIILRASGAYDILGPTGTSLGYPTVAAKPGDSIVLFAVGLGATSPAVPAGQPFSGAAATTNPVKLAMNGVAVTPSFAGLSSAGLYQINLTVPAGLGSGEIPLVATVGAVQTQTGVVLSVQ